MRDPGALVGIVIGIALLGLLQRIRALPGPEDVGDVGPDTFVDEFGFPIPDAT